MDAREAWIRKHAAELRRVLEHPQARAEILALLNGDDEETRRKRRLAELQAGINQHQLKWQRREHGP